MGIITSLLGPEKSQNKILKQLSEPNQYLNLNSLYKVAMLNEFYNTPWLKERVEHTHSTRWQTQGKFKIPKFKNNLEKNILECVIPTICNTIPLNLLSVTANHQRKQQIKNYFIKNQIKAF